MFIKIHLNNFIIINTQKIYKVFTKINKQFHIKQDKKIYIFNLIMMIFIFTYLWVKIDDFIFPF